MPFLRGVILLSASLAFVTFLSCGKSILSPRERVLEFVRLIQADTLPDVLSYIDLDSVSTYEYSETKYDSLSPQQKKSRLLAGFVGQGEYRRTWSRSQIVVNKEDFLDDSTAAVEVSFIDRATRIQYYTRMGLKLRASRWTICNFKI